MRSRRSRPAGTTSSAARLLPTRPGGETAVLRDLGGTKAGRAALDALTEGGGVVLVGERMATVPGALTAAAALAESTGSRLAWIPRRAGERGALEAGALGALLPGGRPAASAAGPHRGRRGLGRRRAARHGRP